MDSSGIKEIVLSEIREIASKYEADKVILFGSRARGDHWNRSDIDLAVYGGDCVRIALAIDEETDTLLSFDIIDMNQPIAEELRENIEREGKVIYEKI